MSDTPELRPLQQAELDAKGVRELAADLEALAVVHEVRVKQRARAMSDEGQLELRSALAALEDGELTGVQILYTFDGRRWLDTLIATAAGTRLVRNPVPGAPG